MKKLILITLVLSAVLGCSKPAAVSDTSSLKKFEPAPQAKPIAIPMH